jgi:hypothetical protein
MKLYRLPRGPSTIPLRPPSFGFLLLAISYGLLVSLLAWGYRQPDLESGWYILQKMQRANFAGLAPPDVQTLNRLLHKYPQFARALIGRSALGFVEPTDDGWMSLPEAHVVVQASPSVPLKVLVDCRAPRSAYPVSVAIELSGSRVVLEFAESSQKVVDWSTKTSSVPLWAQVNVKPSSPRVGTSAGPEVRIRAANADSQKATSWQ